MAKKGTLIRVKTRQLGPRLAASAAWMNLAQLKKERTWLRYGVLGVVDGEAGVLESGTVGLHLPIALQRLETGEYQYIEYFSLNADYHTFTVTKFTREDEEPHG